MESGRASRQEQEEARKRHSWFGCYGDDDGHDWPEQAHRDGEDSLSVRRSAASPPPCSKGLSFYCRDEAETSTHKGTTSVKFDSSSISPMASSEVSIGLKCIHNHQSLFHPLPSRPPVWPSFLSRLQLVKPLDGSQILRQWQKLATPSFTKALFEAPTPCVQSRVGRGLEVTLLPSAAASSSSSSSSRNFQLPSSAAVDSPLFSSQWSSASITDDRQRLRDVPFDQVLLRPRNQTQPPAVNRPSSIGHDLSAQLLTNSLRAHSVERIPSLLPPPPPAPPPTRHRHSSEVETSLFSLASLLSAFSPICPATSTTATSGRLSPKVTGGGGAPGACASRQHFLHTRGLVDVPRVFETSEHLSDRPATSSSTDVFEKNTVHRVTRSSRLLGEETGASRLPSAMPPPWPIQQPAGSVANRSRTSVTTTASAVGLTGILEEEAGSPPKTDVLGAAE